MPRSPKGRAAARGLDARLRLQHAYMPAGDASLKTAQLIKMLVDSNHGIYRVHSTHVCSGPTTSFPGALAEVRSPPESDQSSIPPVRSKRANNGSVARPYSITSSAV